MSSPSSPAIIFLPGIMCKATAVYAPLIQHLTSHYNIPTSDLQAIDLPSTDPTASHDPNVLEADIGVIRSHIQSLLSSNSNRNILLIAHSYSGSLSLAASAGLWAHLRSSGTGGVVKVGLVAASLNPPGAAIAGDREGWKQANPEQAHKINDEKGAKIDMRGENDVWVVPDGVEELWMDDFVPGVGEVSSEEMAKVKASLVPCAIGGALTPMIGKPEDVKDWRVDYLMTTGDKDAAMPESFQKWLVERAKERGADVHVTACQDAGHFPMVSRLKEVGEWVDGLVKQA